MAQGKTKDMTQGAPLGLILGFFWPVVAGLLFQQLYVFVDTIIVGRFLGTVALAAVGCTSSVTMLTTGFCVGACSGFAIPIARSFGEELVFDDGGRRRFYVTLGQFTLVRLERDTQLLIPVYDYCIPQAECSCGDQEDPCGLFRNVAFPIGEFFPPSTLEMPKDYAATRSYCACH